MHWTLGTAARRDGVRHFPGFKFFLLPSRVYGRPRPPLTPTVGWLWRVRNLVYFYLDEIERAFYNLIKENAL